MVGRHTDTDGRPDKSAGCLADAKGDFLGTDGIGTDQPIRAVLLGGTDRQNDSARRLQIVFDFRPSAELKAHRPSRWFPPDRFFEAIRSDVTPW
jgi:hypothetical protein